jgi:Glu-tRNA(Gln) amidotransferase subunit E-like FAD-binding protein
MKDSVMLYRHPGEHFLHNDWFDYIIVLQNEAEIHLKKGWSRTTAEAKAKAQSKEKNEMYKKRRLDQLSKEEIEKILDSKESYRHIGKLFNISPYMVGKIKKNGGS